MKVLIIGGGGYVGRIVKDSLEAVHQVSYLDLRPVKGAEDRTFVGNLSDDQIIKRAVQGQQAIINMALGQHPGDKFSCDLLDPAFDVNLRDQYRALTLGLAAGVRHFTTISTLSIYDARDRKDRNFVDETVEPSCFHPYGLSKRLAEHVYEVAALNHPDSVFMLLRFNLPKNEADFVDKHVFDPALGNQNTCAMGPNDIRRLMLAALACKTPGCHIVQTTGDLTGVRYPNTRATQLLGWAPQGN